jgi:CxxC motif-containing protein (DUF1111 family)
MRRLPQSAYYGTDPRCRPLIPRDATIVSRRIPTPWFGLGLVEAIPEKPSRTGPAIASVAWTGRNASLQWLF